MTIRGRVTAVKGKTRHVVGHRDVTHEAVRIEICEESGLFLLYRIDDCGKVLTDTAHSTLEEAKQQAIFEYDVIWE